ncbi:unnamed protein product [Rotaria sp. Silwood2]|nr:unnamed protein product [Rotaria sp. Silwood2]CAF2866925.1 unnamed protein product [Rotaria sp. Silwood2]CAF2866943.1 unnamed protein product [Rotaria sp. Silwood2]CAF4335446.1 unnamed protein product [Rotaria sp. Silwood2]CAF4378352.1 unnamed protein product [Rotaria sp. Silwood2]
MNTQYNTEIIKKFIQGRRELVLRIIQIADKLDQHHRNVKITKVVTNSTGIFGGLIALGSVLLAVPTAGLSLTAFVGGGILATASTIAHVGSDIVEYVLSRANLDDLNMLCKTDETNFLQLNRYVNEQIDRLQNENSSETTISSTTSTIAAQLTTVNLACSIVRVTQGATLTVRTIRVIGRASIFLSKSSTCY